MNDFADGSRSDDRDSSAQHGIYQISPAHDQVCGVVAWYCLLQACAVLIWWTSLLMFPSITFYFWPESLGFDALNALLVSDLSIYVGLGFCVSWLAFHRFHILRLGLWSMLGGITYATLISFSATLSTGQAVSGAILMGMSWLGFAHLVLAEYFSQREHISHVFRNATDSTSRRNLLATGGQLIIFWPLILGVFPWLITKLQAMVPLPFFGSTMTFGLGLFAFVVVSLINLHTAWTMASFGAGTPFPYDKTNRLVDRGLYGWIRNPMAVTGLAQGTCVGVMYGSVLVLVYVLCGGLIWHFQVRPIEEEMLLDQFGEEYRVYRHRVGLWLPKGIGKIS